jgi:decaprenylphospho-beta-D-erythro-pentofuranosid-2-ulose 2-reductase
MLNGLGQIQNILVIGGKSQIALETVINVSLAPKGKVFLLGREIEKENIAIDNAEVTTVNYDINDPAQQIEKISELFDKRDFDLVILAIGYLGFQPSKSTIEEDQTVIDVNFTYSARVLNYVTDRLKSQNHGKVLILSSVASVRPRKSNYIYGAAKSGLDFFARGLQLDLLGTGVDICIARPGFVHSNMTKGMTPAPFAISAAKAGEICARGILKSKKVFFVPGILRYVMFIVKLLPYKILNKLN